MKKIPYTVSVRKAHDEIEDDHEPLDTEEEQIAVSVSKSFLKKGTSDHAPTQNDKDLMEAETKMDRIEGQMEQLYKNQDTNDYSPVIAVVKENRLLENFRYIQIILHILIRSLFSTCVLSVLMHESHFRLLRHFEMNPDVTLFFY